MRVVTDRAAFRETAADAPAGARVPVDLRAGGGRAMTPVARVAAAPSRSPVRAPGAERRRTDDGVQTTERAREICSTT